ncbi:GntR family transcriptional regulator [Mycolicibacterium fluoranthenivorans]|nr:GntR family transcriptional regulator [Mycolicibacterium fluoranthenivorans]
MPLAVELDRSSPVPLYHQLAQAIEAAIRNGECAPGERFENELAMGRRLTLSRPTVRRAVQEVVDKGLLIRKRGVGTLVAPNPQHQRAERRQSRLIGTMFGMVSGNIQFNMQVLDGLYAAATSRGYELVLSAITESRDEVRAVEALQAFHPDAAIMLDPPTPSPALAGKLPMVTIGWSVDDEAVDVVRTDDLVGMKQAVSHLAERGHRHIVHVDGGEGEVSRARRAAYVAAMTEAGHQAEIRLISGGETQMDGYFAARALLDDPVLPTAVIAFNDELAVSVVESLVHAGYRVPHDVSVIGWDNSALSKLPHTRLTTVAQDTKAISELAIDRAIARIEGASAGPREIVLRPELMIRATTGAARD